jgi:hypothetical protein
MKTAAGAGGGTYSPEPGRAKARKNSGCASQIASQAWSAGKGNASNHAGSTAAN